MENSQTQRVWAAILTVLLTVSCGLAFFDSKSETVERLADIVGLRQGMTLADLGAGDGEWTIELAKLVGRDGRVLATEVDDEKLRDLRRAAKKAKFKNIEVVEGDQQRTGLGESCCDVIHIRNVYHHFEKPEAMLAEIRRALKPGGRVAIIDFGPDNGLSTDNTPEIREGHGVAPQAVIDEMTSSGFDFVEKVDRWQGRGNRYLLVFKR